MNRLLWYSRIAKRGVGPRDEGSDLPVVHCQKDVVVESLGHVEGGYQGPRLLDHHWLPRWRLSVNGRRGADSQKGRRRAIRAPVNPHDHVSWQHPLRAALYHRSTRRIQYVCRGHRSPARPFVARQPRRDPDPPSSGGHSGTRIGFNSRRLRPGWQGGAESSGGGTISTSHLSSRKLTTMIVNLLT